MAIPCLIAPRDPTSCHEPRHSSECQEGTDGKFDSQAVFSAALWRRWPVSGGKITIPYTFVTANEVVMNNVNDAIAEWEAKACVDFVPYTGQTDYLQVWPVGRQRQGHAESQYCSEPSRPPWAAHL